MQIPVQLTGKGVELTADQEAVVHSAVAGLERFFSRLVACRAVVSVPHRRPAGAPVAWTMRLSLTVPGGELAITRKAKPSFREAVDDAFDAARRRLQDYARELRGDVKVRAGEQRGRVSRLLSYEGYGFLAAEDGGEIYFHRNSVPDGGFDRLTIGTEVSYVEAEGDEGPQASTVVPRGHPASAASSAGEVF